MNVIENLACSLGRRDELPNQELARRIIEDHDHAGIRELVSNLWNKTNPNIAADCIKVLYEIGYREPGMIAGYTGDFLRLLKSRINRMTWGGMLALSTIASRAADELYPHTADIMAAMKGGSVITRDAGVLVLAEIAATGEERRVSILPFLFEALRLCRPKDIPQHCEKILIAVNASHREAFIAILKKRTEDLNDTQLKRVMKVIRQAELKQ